MLLTRSALTTGLPQLNLTPDEKRVFGQLFQQADTDSLGVVTGEVAVKFFERTKLAPSVLGEVRSPMIAHLSARQIMLTVPEPSCRYGKSQILRIGGC
jgi:hypothetical protein